MSNAGIRWEIRRLSEFGTAVLCFAAGVAYCLTREGAGEAPIDWFLPAFILAGALGACVAADANVFAGREEGVADLAFLVSRPVGRMPLFRLRLGVVAAWAALVWGGSAGYCLAAAVPGPRAGAWTSDWLMSLVAYLFLALAMLGLATEPRVGLRERLRSRTLALKLAPLLLLAAALWAPILTAALDRSRTGPGEYWMARAPILFPAALAVLTFSYVAGLARDWARTDIVS